MTLGQNIYRLRTERGLSQGDLAEALDVSRQSVSKWETDGSVPELEKLLRLSELFHITLDELVKGSDGAAETPSPAPEEAATGEPEDALLETLSRGVNRTIGWVALGFGALVAVLVAIAGGGLAGLVYAAPLFLCGVIYLTVKRRAGLWCAWACGLLGLAWLRAATGISWSGVFVASSMIFRNDVAQVVAWVVAVFLLLLLIGTVRSFREQVLPWERRSVGKYAGLWALYFGGRWAVNRFLFRPWILSFVTESGRYSAVSTTAYDIASILWEILQLVLLAILLVKTAALLRGRKAARAAAS